jgi:phosphopantetheinyl transferase
MSASEDVSHNAAGPSGFSLYVFRDIRALLPSRALGSRSALRDDDYAEARRYARDADAEDFLRRRVCLYAGLDHWFSLIGYPSLGSDDRIIRSELGKPVLQRAGGSRYTAFNLSARSDAILLGVSTDREIGVDLEDSRRRIKPGSMRAVMDYYYLPGERNLVREAGEDPEAFLRIWTKKEAAVKARGLSIGSHGMMVDTMAEDGDPWFQSGGLKIFGVSGELAGGYNWSAALVCPDPLDREPRLIYGNSLIPDA